VSKAAVLIIDDEVDLLTMLKYKFEKTGFTVQTAENGLDGLAKLKTFTPDIIILDVNMPKMGGIEFYNEICIVGRPRFPVYILTARANLENLFKDLEVEGFMSKPFEVDLLIGDIERILAKNKKAAAHLAGVAAAAKKVLIVDNDPGNLKRIADIFLEKGFQVSIAHDGASAVEMISVGRPDVAVIKWELRDIKGHEIALRTLKLERTHPIRFVLFTSHPPDDIKVMDESRKISCIDQIVESSQPTDIFDGVMECLNAKKGEGEDA
jgi:DNA-binding response OmpR family regulator